MEYILAHDLGTSADKAVLVGLDGKAAMCETCGYDVLYPFAGGAEQRPKDWMNAFLSTTKRIVEKVGAERIAAVTFCGQMHACVCMDAGGTVLRDAMIWMDQRAGRETDALSREVPARKIHSITGHRPGVMYTLEKAMWVKRNEPDLFAKTAMITGAKDYLLFHLTGRHVTDYSDASGMGAYDIRARRWSEELCCAAGVDTALFPEAVGSTAIVGKITKETAGITGLLIGTPIFAGGGDGPCASAGAGVFVPGSAYLCGGTSAWVAAAAEQPCCDDEMLLTNYIQLDGRYYMLTGSVSSWGNVYDWAVRKLYGEEDAAYAYAERELEKSPPGANGLLFLPWLGGERAPIWNPDARGSFIGLSFPHTRGDMMRAAAEGLGFNLAVLLRAMRRFMPIDALNMIGGGGNDAWRQIVADILGARLSPAQNSRYATSMGAAMAAMVGLGALKDFREGAAFLPWEGETRPCPANRAAYDRLSVLYAESYRALRPMFGEIAAFLRGVGS